MKALWMLCHAVVLFLCGNLAAGAQDAGPEAGRGNISNASLLIVKAREQIGVTTRYDGSYEVISYPNGDVPVERGVCTDVVIRAMRGVGLDLQQAVHEDMKAHFGKYPKLWGLKSTDRNIDHRRVPNLMTYFERRGWKKSVGTKADDYLPGDLVTWLLPGSLPHIGIVSDRKTEDGTPLIIHHIGNGTQEEDCLFDFRITGHYRPVIP